MSNEYKFKTKLKLQNAINLWTSNKNSAKKNMEILRTGM